MGNNEIAKILKAYSEETLEEKITECATADSCIIAIAKKMPPGFSSSVTIIANSKDQLSDKLQNYIKKGYSFSVDTTFVTCSLHQIELRDGRAVLLEAIKQKRPSVSANTKAIKAIGTAFNNQIDMDKAVFNKREVKNNIFSKLEAIGLISEKDPLFKKYESLNRFYNATKHLKSVKNKKDQEMLNTINGIKIALDYYETVRRILILYYEKRLGKAPQWEELTPIPIDLMYKDISYTYDIEQMWQ